MGLQSAGHLQIPDPPIADRVGPDPLPAIGLILRVVRRGRIEGELPDVATIQERAIATERPPTTGASVLVESLVRHGVDVVFAYPGGASMPMHQALTFYRDKIRTILPRHEQGGIFAAEGYARVTGKPGVVMATSGPGALNLVTGLADAKLDSLPIVAITGQVPTKVIGTDAFQETPMVEVCRAITKHHYLVQDARDVARIVKEAFHIASTGRPGPVLIDMPKDIQNTLVPNPDYDVAMDLPGYRLPGPPSAEKVRQDRRGDQAGPPADHLLRRRHRLRRRVGGAPRVRPQDRHPRRHDLARAGRDPQRPLPGPRDARDARDGLLEHGDQRGRPAAGLRRPVRRPGDRQAQRVRQARPDRPRRHRRLGDQQEQDGAHRRQLRREDDPRPAQPDRRGRRLPRVAPAGRRLAREPTR